MIEVVKENPCKDCGIKGLYENCSEKCVQYRKYFQYKQGRADAIEEIKKYAYRNIHFYDAIEQVDYISF